MRVNDALTPEEVDEGWVLTCQSLPTGPPVDRGVRTALISRPGPQATGASADNEVLLTGEVDLRRMAGPGEGTVRGSPGAAGLGRERTEDECRISGHGPGAHVGR